MYKQLLQNDIQHKIRSVNKYHGGVDKGGGRARMIHED